MEILQLISILLAVGPPVGIAYLIYQSDRWEREGQWPLLWSWLFGMGACYLAFVWEAAMRDYLWVDQVLLRAILASFIGVALIEEGLKFLVLWLYPYRRPFFNEPMDGIVYATMIAMGLAALENVWYAWNVGLPITLWRSLTAVPAHAVFAIFQGYYFGRARFEPEQERYLLLRGLISAIFLHGIYNFLVIQEAFRWLLLLAGPLIGLTAWLAYDLLRTQQQNSPFRPKGE